MKYLLCLLLLVSTPAFAATCIVDHNNNVIGKTSYTPDINDLNTRQEFAVQCDDAIVIGNADYRNNAVITHIKTQAELDAVTNAANAATARAASRASAIAKLKALGLTDAEAASMGGN